MTPRFRSAVRPGNSGHVLLVLVLVAALLMGVFGPMIYRLIHNESRGAVKGKKSRTAFNYAEAGVERGYWRLRQDPDTVGQVMANNIPAGYDGTVTFTDIPGGAYRVTLTPDAGRILVTGTGKEFSGKEFRAIRAVYAGGLTGVQAPLMAAKVGPLNGGGGVFWGPMISQSEMHLNGAVDQLFPRKMARASIKATPQPQYGHRDLSPYPPNKGPQVDHLEWWSYNEDNVVPDMPVPDIAYYRDLAKAQGSYYAKNENFTNFNDTTCTEGTDRKVWFFEGNVRFDGETFLCGDLFAMGHVTFAGTGDAPIMDWRNRATPPATAWKEYMVNVPAHAWLDASKVLDDGDYDTAAAHNAATNACAPPHGDTLAAHEYPGDAAGTAQSPHAVEEYKFGSGCVAHGDPGGKTGYMPTRQLTFRGYLFAGMKYTASADTVVYGAVQVGDNSGAGGIIQSGWIFFDENLTLKSAHIAKGSDIHRVSWQEIPAIAF